MLVYKTHADISISEMLCAIYNTSGINTNQQFKIERQGITGLVETALNI